MRVLYRYFLILIACASILFGIQIPNFVDQYEKRLDAHFLEVQNNLRGYQEIADRHCGGSMEVLIKKHEESEDRALREETEPIRNIYKRYLSFQSERGSLETGLAGKIAFIIAKGDRTLINETYINYSFTIPLNQSAVLSGVLSAAFVLVVVELLLLALSRLFRSPRRRFTLPSGGWR
ncbi:MAG: DUF2937 family protein [Syntrophobacterales bacterium]|nr:MAG: DUF2937 family protein [Syntrophobacterales bacterium]